MSRELSRRDFAKLAAMAAASIAGGSTLVGCSLADNVIMHKQTITDDAGRTLDVPTADAIESIFFTSGLAQVYIVALIPEKLGGSAAKFTEEELQYLP